MPPAGITRRHAAEAGGDPLGERPGVAQHELPQAGGRRRRERRGDPRLRVRADATDLAEPSLRSRVAQFLDRADPERGADLDEALRGEAVHAAERRELRRDALPQLLDLRQPPGLHQLAEAGLDPGPDAAQASHPAVPHEVGNRRGRGPQELRGAPVGPGRIGVRLRQLEQRGVLVEGRGQVRVRRRHARNATGRGRETAGRGPGVSSVKQRGVVRVFQIGLAPSQIREGSVTVCGGSARQPPARS